MLEKLPLMMNQIREACARLGYTFTLLDTHSGYLARISKAGKSIPVGIGPINAYPLNQATSAAIVADKGFAQQIMMESGIPTPRGDFFFISKAYADMREPGKEVSDALVLAESLGYPVIAKPAHGSRGNGVQPVFDSIDLQRHLESLSAHHYVAMVQAWEVGKEYRVFVLDGEVKFTYRKKPKQVHFDRLDEFHVFLKAENQRRHGQGLYPFDLQSGYIYHLEKEIQQGKSIVWASLSMASGQAQVAEFSTTSTPALDWLATQLTQAFGLRVFAFDYILKQGTLEHPTGVVLEVNANPMLDTATTAGPPTLVPRLWEEILQKAFG